MVGYIRSIKSSLFGGVKKIDLVLDGKNLILVGGNGCGKTQLLSKMFQSLDVRIQRGLNPNLDVLQSEIFTIKQSIQNGDRYTHHQTDNLRRLEDEFDVCTNPQIEIEKFDEFRGRIGSFSAVLLNFDAHRKANIRDNSSVLSGAHLRHQVDSGKAYSEVFEDYLIWLKTALAYAESPSVDNDFQKAESIKSWFEKLQSDLRELYEDDSLDLKFDSESLSFLIVQEGRLPYRFQQLSSGFSSILSIYTELIARVELREVKPEELSGVVFIDEIDVHLHVSLQRKIFSFLTRSFPNVQFIVSTHSPFVVSSVSNAVIYDMSRGEEVGDVSMYSYEALLEGLFGVLAVSDILRGKIIELATLTVMPEPNFTRVQELVLEIEEAENKLDPESLFYLNRARVALSKVGYGG